MKKRLRIFVVDDDPLLAGVVKLLLERAGHEATVCASGADALAAIPAARPDCVLLDIMMPTIDGLETCRRLRACPDLGATKIVMLSTKSYEFDRRRAFELGADGYITKPIDRETFAADVARIVEDAVTIRFWGVRGTLPRPGPGTLRYGGNTACVSVGLPKDRLWIFDAGSGIKNLSDHLRAGGRRRLEAKIFISHPHWDHINALPFFAPLYAQGNDIEILGPAHGDVSMADLVSAQMNGVYFPITTREFGARVTFRDLCEGTYEFDRVRLATMLLYHPGSCLGYRVDYRGRSVCYVTDNELYPPSSANYSEKYIGDLVRFVRMADVLITDCTYTDEEYAAKVNWGHSSVSRVVDLADRAEVKRLCLFHHDPDQTDGDIDRKLESAAALLGRRRSATACLAPAEGELIEL